MAENLPRARWKEELSDYLSGLVAYLRQMDAQIQAHLDAETDLSAESRERLADLQENLRAPQNYFTEASEYVRRWS